MLKWWQPLETGVFIMEEKNIFFRRKKTIIILIIALIIAIGYPIVRIIKAQSMSASYDTSQPKELAVIQGNSLLAVADHSLVIAGKNAMLSKAVKKDNPKLYTLSSLNSCPKIEMTITAYSSTPEQTDSTPFITASGSSVKDGVVANNILPFGTKIKIPELYGEKIFEVTDRMHSRKGSDRLDIWFPSYKEALSFGVKKTSIEIVE